MLLVRRWPFWGLFSHVGSFLHQSKRGAFIEGRFLLLQHSLAIQSIVMCFQRSIKNGLIAINPMLERGLVEAYEHKIFYTYRYFTNCS